jgi:uncharacterized protein (DUF58 family)
MNEGTDRGAEGVAPVARKAAELRRLELLVTRRLDGLLRGEFLGVQSGPGSEVAGARSYEPGDDSRWIDWNLTARSVAPQIRTTEADRELQTWALVDRSASMSFGTAEREKADVAPEILRHRLILTYDALADGVTTDDVIARVLATMPVPQVTPRQESGLQDTA